MVEVLLNMHVFVKHLLHMLSNFHFSVVIVPPFSRLYQEVTTPVDFAVFLT